jgi:hypothetical protein
MADPPLPRQTYKTDEHARIEQEIAERFARWAKGEQMRIGLDARDKQKPRVDRIFIRDNYVRGCFECKSSSVNFGHGNTWVTGIRKVRSLRQVHDLLAVPVLIVVKFGCGTIAFVDSADDFSILRGWGRADRNDPGDAEDGARFLWSQFRKVT